MGSLDAMKLHPVAGRASIADIFPPNRRCGLYVLQFANGELYAGQAVDVTRRYAQHHLVHPDIESIAFRQVPRRRLNEEERSLIQRLESEGNRLRNITFAAMPANESDLDLVVTAEEQQRWLDDLYYTPDGGDRMNDLDLRRRYLRRFQEFAGLPNAEQVVDVYRELLRRTVPAPLRTETSFWAISCMPDEGLYCRLNIHVQEVSTAWESEEGLRFSFSVAWSPLDGVLGPDLLQRNPTLHFQPSLYPSGGADQIYLTVLGSENALLLLEEEAVVEAMRLFNICLMRKGPCLNNRSHCLELADLLLEQQAS